MSGGGRGEDGNFGFADQVGRIYGGNGPERRVSQQAADELSMQSVGRLVRLYARQEWQTSQSKVANQIESLVAANLVRKSQRPVHHAVIGQDNVVVQRAA